MKKNDKFKIAITDETFFEDLIWMSYRYCIGRKTIAASMHAGNIAKSVYGVLSKERQRFMAHDIRREINDRITWLKNIKVVDFRHHITQDGLSSILYRILEKYGPTPFEWVINDVRYEVENDIVSMDKFEEGVPNTYDNILTYYGDLIGWIKLANLLDDECHKIVVVVGDEGEIYEHKCFPYPYIYKAYDGGITLGKRWVPIERFLENPFVETYVASEFITEIKNIE